MGLATLLFGRQSESVSSMNYAYSLRRVLTIFLLASGFASAQSLTAFDYAKLLGQGLNLGNTLEAPNEGDWGFVLQPWHFDAIARGGFDSVRVPIKFSGHAMQNAPYTINESFMQRIDWVIDQAKLRDLAVIVDLHHYDEMATNPNAHRDRLNGLWSQIATRYQDQPKSVFFEILNEPNTALTSPIWNSMLVDALDTIRQTNPGSPSHHWANVLEQPVRARLVGVAGR